MLLLTGKPYLDKALQHELIAPSSGIRIIGTTRGVPERPTKRRAHYDNHLVETQDGRPNRLGQAQDGAR